MKDRMIYKIVPQESWPQAESQGCFGGSGIDLQDGFIHCSTARQVVATAERYFAGQTGLLLITIDPAALGNTLRFEPSRDGQLFPHIYGELPKEAVIRVDPLPLDERGYHVFPEGLRDA